MSVCSADLARSISIRNCAIEDLRRLKEELVDSEEADIELYHRGVVAVSIHKDEVIRQLDAQIHQQKEALADLIRQLVLFIETPSDGVL